MATYPTKRQEGHLFITIIIRVCILDLLGSSQVNLSPLISVQHVHCQSLLLCADVCEARSIRSIHKNACQRKWRETTERNYNYETAGWVWQVYNILPSFFSFSHLIFSLPLSHRMMSKASFRNNEKEESFTESNYTQNVSISFFQKHSELPINGAFKVHYTYQYLCCTGSCCPYWAF